MANHKSAKKRIRQTETRRLSNKWKTSRLRTEIKKLRTFLTEGNKEEAIKQLPYVQIDTVLTSSNMQDTDDDIEQSLNLFFNIPDLEMGYPQWKWIDSSTFYHPKILTVADSYYWGMFNFGMSTNAFGNGQFWFYNESIYPDSYSKPINVDDINLKKSVEQNKAVLLLFTDANLNRFGFGFIDDLYHEYYFSKVSND